MTLPALEDPSRPLPHARLGQPPEDRTDEASTDPPPGQPLPATAAPGSAGWLAPVLLAGTLAATLSGAVLMWRSRAETGHASAAVNAPSQWLWGRGAIEANDVDARHTLLGTAVHWLSSCFWAVGFEWLRRRHPQDTPLTALRDGAATAGLAAFTDLALVPERLTPGFEKRLSRRSLGGVYATFAVGLAVAALLSRRR
jgi:hypothetical protein